MERYSKITGKIKREIVLLKARPCAWGKCRFCDYIHDNTTNLEEVERINCETLAHVTGEYGVLEVIDSASCFELTPRTMTEIKRVVAEKKIGKLFLEAHWMYRKRLGEMRDFFGIPIVFKTGVETFDYNFRENYLKKNAPFRSPEEVAEYFDSPCLMVCVKGQTKEMIRRDIELAKKHFRHMTVNVFTDNTTDVKRDPELVKWFVEEFGWLASDPDVDILLDRTDFGVGD